MAGLYRKVSVAVWGDERFRRLSKPKPNAQSLLIYLVTGPHTTSLPGLFVAGPASLAEALGWPPPAFRRCFAELTTEGIAKADWHARVVWLPNAVRHNPPDNPNVVRSWRKTLEFVPECDLKREAVDALASFLATIGEPYAEAFSRPFRERSQEPSAKQEQYDQYQKHKQHQKQQRASTSTPKLAHDGSRLRVWAWQHEDLSKRLGAKAETFDLLGWYARLESELASTGEAFADPWKWLQERLYRDAALPLPNLMGRSKTSGNLTAAQRFIARGQQ